jgi:predicted O-methyltransferase YrrM
MDLWCAARQAAALTFTHSFISMFEQVWGDVDEFFTQHLLPSDDALRATLETNVAEQLPPIAVTPPQGKLLHLLARASGARRILEIGTLGGYSTIWMARALKPGGQLITLEIDPHHAEVARRNLTRAGLSDRVEVRIGRAAALLDAMLGFVEPFDFVFIDADKASSDVYFMKVLALSHAGTVIIVDNVVRDGKVADAASDDEDIQGIRRMTEWLATQPNISATAIQTVGGKSYDGFLMAIVNGG